MTHAGINATWDSGSAHCWLTETDGSLFGRLHIREWWSIGERVAVPAWALEWVNPGGPEARPPMFVALVELPARRVTSAQGRSALVRAAIATKQRGESAPLPPAAPIDEREWPAIAEGLDRLFGAWVDAEAAFSRAANSRDEPAAGRDRWTTLTDALNRIYAIDSTLRTLWNKLPMDLREDASRWADDYADRTIAHNRGLDSGFDPAVAAGWEAWRERQRTAKPYEHWSGPLLAGLFHKDFFTGLRWVRGQLTYHAVPEPIELRQLRPGDEPRWKWRVASAVSTEGGNERAAYDAHLAGQDVLGQLAWLIDVFVDAQKVVGRLRKRADGRR